MVTTPTVCFENSEWGMEPELDEMLTDAEFEQRMRIRNHGPTWQQMHDNLMEWLDENSARAATR